MLNQERSPFTRVVLLIYSCAGSYFVKDILIFVRKEQLIQLSVL